MGAKSRRLLAPCEVGMTTENWICGRFRLFPVSEIRPLRSGVSLDRAALVSQTRVGPRFRWSGTHFALDWVFRIRRRQCRERWPRGSGRPASRGTVRRPDPNGGRSPILNLRLDPVCGHPRPGRSADQQGGGLRQENQHRELVWRPRPG